jgi:integrase/recombinase XerD
MMTDEAAFALWESHMRAAGNVDRTINERWINLRSLGKFLGKPVVEASRFDLIAWLGRPTLSPKTRQNYRSFLHTFYTLIQDEGIRLDNPSTRLPKGKTPVVEANPFSTADVQRLLDSGIYGRTRMMILLAAYQGFRAVEISATSGSHIDWVEKRILTVEAKGGSEVWRPLHPAVIEYAATDPKKFLRDGYWFPGTKSRKGQHIKPSSVSNVVSAAMKRAGIERHRPHQIRAWHATELIEAGADLITVQHSMRHANANTLRHYVRPSMANIEAAMIALPSLTAVR